VPSTIDFQHDSMVPSNIVLCVILPRYESAISVQILQHDGNNRIRTQIYRVSLSDDSNNEMVDGFNHRHWKAEFVREYNTDGIGN
jgi:hypothetical protein